MKKHIFSLLSIFFLNLFGVAFSQGIDASIDSVIYDIVEIPAKAEFDLQKYLSENLIYPEQALDENIEGKIYVQLVVERNGKISSAEAVRGGGIGFGLAEEAVRVVLSMPQWKPAENRLKIVRSKLTLPISFQIIQDTTVEGIVTPSTLEKLVNDIINQKNDTIETAQPEFDLTKYISKNLKYPKAAYEEGIEGRVLIQFEIDVNGDVINAMVFKGEKLGHGLPQAALDLIKKMPKWIPAKSGDKPVKSIMVLPVTFKINSQTIYGPTIHNFRTW